MKVKELLKLINEGFKDKTPEELDKYNWIYIVRDIIKNNNIGLDYISWDTISSTWGLLLSDKKNNAILYFKIKTTIFGKGTRRSKRIIKEVIIGEYNGFRSSNTFDTFDTYKEDLEKDIFELLDYYNYRIEERKEMESNKSNNKIEQFKEKLQKFNMSIEDLNSIIKDCSNMNKSEMERLGINKVYYRS